jgi:large subunit ribosomal protein L29
MAIIRTGEMAELTDKELMEKEEEFRRELNAERGKVATGGRTSNPGKIRELKRSIARILTILNERKLGIWRKKKGPRPAADKQNAGPKKEEAKKEEEVRQEDG